MPCVYQDREGISLYDAQWPTSQQQPIPDETILLVIKAMARFQQTCRDFGVPTSQIRILATEATRIAINSAKFCSDIQRATGWTVEMLPKEEEGRVGCMGVASSFETLKGLMMDLGGGSCQLTWLICRDGELRMSEAGSVSMPYGAAALSRRLAEANQAGGQAINQFREEICTNLKNALEKIKLPEELKNEITSPHGLNLYCSGGGLRGWGFLLMSQHEVQPYPCPIINGFKTHTAEFQNAQMVLATAQNDEETFRVSERRSDQVPGVACLIGCMIDTLPAVKTIYFAQGGVREGALFLTMDKKTRQQSPLEVSTRPYTTPSSAAFAKLLHAANPQPPAPSDDEDAPVMNPNTITAFAQSMFIHNGINKDLQAASALRSTTSGTLAPAHGVSHDDRAMLGTMLCERWGGVSKLSPSDAFFYQTQFKLLSPAARWWVLYIGRLGAVLGQIFPAGVIDESAGLIALNARWTFGDNGAADSEGTIQLKKEKSGTKKHKDDKKQKKEKQAAEKNKAKLTLDVLLGEDLAGSEDILKGLGRVQKLGSKKNWPGETGGHKIEIKARIKTE